MAALIAKEARHPTQAKRLAVLEHIRTKAWADPSAIARAQAVAERTSQPIEQVLNQLGSLSDENLVAAYAAVAGCKVWDPALQPISVSKDEIGVSIEYLRRARVAPLSRSKDTLHCAVCDPLDDEAIMGLVFATSRKVNFVVAKPSDWRRCFDLAFDERASAPAAPDARRLEREIELVSDSAADGTGSRLVASVFDAAIAAGASDIHFEPRRNDMAVRFRVDGRMLEHAVVSTDLAAPAVSRVKVIANLDIGEKRLPQDGRTTFVISGRQVDVRVATSPTVFGESAVLRILDRASIPLDLEALGMSPHIRELLLRAAKSPHGMFLITGPTGSGKTTTLYALLQSFAGSARKVLSVEDPVEYHFDHVSQTQVAPHLGLTFAAALRSFLRQDPDVILVGEIRNPETAAVAVQAAMTGHFVLASVHANDALAVAPRLRDLGVEPYQLTAGLRGAAAQRLVRRLCVECRGSRPATDPDHKLFADAGLPVPEQIPLHVGCPACRGTGFRGRIAIAEAFLTDETSLRLLATAQAAEALSALQARGYRTMLVDGLEKVAEGLTTPEEVMAAVNG